MKYNKIGTSIKSYVDRFVEFCALLENYNFKIVNDNNRYWAGNGNDHKIYNMKSKATCRQMIKSWEALGLIRENNDNSFTIVKKIKSPIEVVALFKNKISFINNLDSYTFHICVNTLFTHQKYGWKYLSKLKLEKAHGGKLQEKDFMKNNTLEIMFLQDYELVDLIERRFKSGIK